MHDLYASHLERSSALAGLAPQAVGLVPAPDGGSPGVSDGAVSQQMKRAREGSPEARRRRPPLGGPRRLSPDQLARLPELFPHGPKAYGVRGDLQTRTRIAVSIRLGFGVSSHPRHVGRIPDVRRWSPQKPTKRAWQRNDAAMAQWHEEPYPALNRGRRRGSRLSSLSINRAFIPCPASPAPRPPWARPQSCGSGALATTSRPSGRSRPRASAPATAKIIPSTLMLSSRFSNPCSAKRRAVIIGNGAPIHGRQVIRDFLANGAAQRLHLERLPAQAQELNPSEGLWQQPKGVELRHGCSFNLPHLWHA